MHQFAMTKDNKGDTIVEVLLALAVLGAIIAGGYSVATRSLNGVRIAQERSEATKLAEGQLEAINQKLASVRVFSDLETPPDGSTPFIGYDDSWATTLGVPATTYQLGGFCVRGDNGEAQKALTSGSDMNQFGNYDPACVHGFYHVYITTSLRLLNYNPANKLADTRQVTYKVNVIWERSGGSGTESLVLENRYTLL